MDKEKDKLNVFVRKIKKEFNPEKIILFGSRASNDAWKRSDYDFIIVSKKFEGMHWLDRISAIVRLWNLESDIDVLTYTPEEFEKMKKISSLVRTALKNNVQLG